MEKGLLDWAVNNAYYATLIAQLLWAVRIVAGGRWRDRRWLLAYLSVNCALMAVGSFILQTADNRVDYARAYVAFNLISFSVLVAALLETALKTVSGYARFTAMQGRLVRGGILVSGGLVAFVWMLAPDAWVLSLRRFFYFQVWIIYASLTLAWLPAVGLSRLGGLPWSPNTRTVVAVLSGILLSGVALSAQHGGPQGEIYYLADVIWSTFCFSFGAICFRSAGETLPVREHAVTVSAEAALARLEHAPFQLRSLIRDE